MCHLFSSFIFWICLFCHLFFLQFYFKVCFFSLQMSIIIFIIFFVCINLLKSALYIYIPYYELTCCPKNGKRNKKFLSYILLSLTHSLLNSVSIFHFLIIQMVSTYVPVTGLSLCPSKNSFFSRFLFVFE